MNKTLQKLMAVMAAVLLLGCVSAAAVDLDKDCALTFSLGTAEQLADDYAELAAVQVSAMLYKVADMTGDYEYTAEKAYANLYLSDYKTLANDGNGNGKLLDKAEEAAEMAADDENGRSLTIENGACKVEGLEPGLYLLIVDEKAAGAHIYSFNPVLVSLPTMETYKVDAEGNVTEEWSGEDDYDVELVVKPSREERMGDLYIYKTVTGGIRAGEPATFVFQIEATMPMENDATRNETVYSDVVSIVLNNDTEGTALVEGRIPVGATVTVTEVYTGAGYTAVGNDEVTVVMEAPLDDETTEEDESIGTPSATVSFTNQLDTTDTTKGSSVTNIFTYDETTGSWKLSGEYDDGRAPVTVG